MSGFSEYAAQQWEGFQEGVGDNARAAYADIGDAYQQFLTADANIGPPENLTADMVHTGAQVELTQSYQAALLEHGVSAGLEAETDHWRDQLMQPEAEAGQPWPAAPEADAPEISAPDIEQPDIDVT